MTNAKRKARRQAQTIVMSATWKGWLADLTEKLTYGKQRPERVAKEEVLAITQALLAKANRFTVEQLRREHITQHPALDVKVATAEVDLYFAKVMQSLRDAGLLLYPVTEDGWNGTYGTDIAAAIPGRGRGRKTFGWCVATGPDPLFEAYWAMRAAPIRGGLTKLVNQSEVAAIAGVVPAAIPRSIIKKLPDGIK